MKTFTITAYSHYFKVEDFCEDGKQAIYRFIQKFLVQYDVVIDSYGNMSQTQKCIFAASNAQRTEFRFHINQLQHFIDWMRYYGSNVSQSTVVHADPPTFAKADFKVLDGWVEREQQLLALDYIFDKNPLTKMLPMQAGSGKTATAFFAMARAKMRTLLVIKPSLQKQWTKDAYPKQLEYAAGDILSVSGRADLLSLIHLAQAGELNAKFIALSNVTLQRYISDWENDQNDPKCPVAPDEMFRLLEIGIIIQDEWHLFFHLNFKIDLYTHCVHNIKLSATVEPDDPFLARMFEIASPKSTRFAGIEYNKYVHVTGYCYSLDNVEKIRMSPRGRSSYSHKQFEESLMKRKRQFENYVNMILWLVEDDYVKVRKEGMKCIVFAERVDMCTRLMHALRKKFPDLLVGRKVSGDKETVLEESDIIVSTLGSMGAGTDIEDVYYILMTTSVSSRSANEQAKGRAREMKKFEGTKPHFAYLYSKDVRKQVLYHNKKIEDFKGKCLSHRSLMLPTRV